MEKNEVEAGYGQSEKGKREKEKDTGGSAGRTGCKSIGETITICLHMYCLLVSVSMSI